MGQGAWETHCCEVEGHEVRELLTLAFDDFSKENNTFKFLPYQAFYVQYEKKSILSCVFRNYLERWKTNVSQVFSPSDCLIVTSVELTNL